MLEAEHPEYQEYLSPDELEAAREGVTLTFKEADSSFLGADTLHVHSFSPPGNKINEDPMFTLWVTLSKDGSPYVPEPIIDEINDSNWITVYVPAEQKPFYAPVDTVENFPRNVAVAGGVVAPYVEGLQALGQEPHWLSDEDIAKLLDILPKLELDPAGLNADNINVYNPRVPRPD